MWKTKIKIFVRECARGLVRLFFLLPMRKKCILFEAFQGRSYACNPKYISEYFAERYPGRFELVWSFEDPERFKDIKGIKKIRYKSFLWFYYQTCAEVVVSNMHPITVIPARKGQMFLETWHAGGAYKRLGQNVISVSPGQALISKWNHGKELERVNGFLTSSEIFTKYNIYETFAGYKGPIIRSGMPRNDIFFDKNKVAGIRKKVRKELGIKGMAVLYAPTYRGEALATSGKVEKPMDGDALLAALRKNGEEATLLVRSHYSDKNRYGGAGTIDVSTYPDMQELLCAADILITDYSSSIWDFALTGRPCFLYVPDLKEYGSEKRGFFVPIEEWPGKICEDMDTLCNAVTHIDPEEHKKRAAAHLQAFGSYEEGRAAEKAAEYIVGPSMP